MVKVISFLFICCVSSLVASSPYTQIYSDLPELLTPVSDEEAYELDLKSKFLNKHKFFASRYQLVRVNFDLFDHYGEEARLTLFDGVSYVVRIMEVDPPEGGASWALKLKIIAPAVTGTDRKGEIFAAMLNEINWHYRPKMFVLNEDETVSNSDLRGMSGISNDAFDERLKNKKNPVRIIYNQLTGEFHSAVYQADFAIYPLPHNPGYHMVYEMDPEKKLNVGYDKQMQRRADQRAHEKQVDDEFKARKEGRREKE